MTDQDLLKLEKVAVLQDSVLLLSPLKGDVQEHQGLGGVAARAAERTVLLHTRSAPRCPVPGNTTSYLYAVRNKTLNQRNEAWKKQGAEGCLNKKGRRRNPWKGSPGTASLERHFTVLGREGELVFHGSVRSTYCAPPCS